MKFLTRLIPLIFTLFFSQFLQAQKGLPPKPVVPIAVNTNYPQHIDFKESMLADLKVPAGFKVAIAATGLGKPRMMKFADDGSLYVTRRDQGDVLLLKDTDGDGRFDDMKPVVTQFKGVHGIAIQGKMMYLCSNRELKKYTINPDNSLSDTMTVFKDLPDGGQHGNRTMEFGPDGKLYLSIGSTCNDCMETNPENATLLQVNVDSNTRRIYARGLRNTIGFAWNPQTKELWGADNGADMKGENLPLEELNMIVDSGHYGWPLVYGKQIPDETREDPPGTTKAAFAKITKSPVLELPAHTAPINMVFLDKASSFPQDYRGDALISLHGSWNRLKPEGYNVQRIRFQNGKPLGSEDFLTGFLLNNGRTRFGRPAGIAISPKGVVYISDDANGIIYSVSAK